MAKSKNFGRNFFLSESIQNVLIRISKQKSRNRKFFLITKFVRGNQSFFAQNDQNSEKMAMSKNFGRNFFWSESIQNVLKRISKRKSRNQKFFPITNFFVGLSHFLPKMTKIVKKWQSQKILIDFFLSESIQNVLKRILK